MDPIWVVKNELINGAANWTVAFILDGYFYNSNPVALEESSFAPIDDLPANLEVSRVTSYWIYNRSTRSLTIDKHSFVCYGIDATVGLYNITQTNPVFRYLAPLFMEKYLVRINIDPIDDDYIWAAKLVAYPAQCGVELIITLFHSQTRKTHKRFRAEMNFTLWIALNINEHWKLDVAACQLISPNSQFIVCVEELTWDAFYSHAAVLRNNEK